MKQLSLVVFLSVVTLIMSMGLITSTGASANTSEENKAVVWRYLNALGTDQQQSVRDQVFSNNFRELRAEFENLYYNIQGSALADAAEPLDQAIPDRKDHIDLVVGEDDTVAVRYRITGTHQGNLYGIPATGQPFAIYAVSIYNLADGEIVDAWHMADEVGLLRQIGQAMPAREDGQYRIPPTGGEAARAADDILQEMLANPVDSREYRNKLNVASRKANNPPPGYIKKSEGLSYDEILRAGFQNLTDIGKATTTIGFGEGFSGRVDRMDYFLMDDDWIFIRFRLTAENSGSLFGLPPSNKPVDAWEVAFMKFEGEHWRTAWWFGDDQSMLMQVDGPQSFWFLDVAAAK